MTHARTFSQRIFRHKKYSTSNCPLLGNFSKRCNYRPLMGFFTAFQVLEIKSVFCHQFCFYRTQNAPCNCWPQGRTFSCTPPLTFLVLLHSFLWFWGVIIFALAGCLWSKSIIILPVLIVDYQITKGLIIFMSSKCMWVGGFKRWLGLLDVA